VSDQVAADQHKFRVGLSCPHRSQAGKKQRVGRVNSAGATSLLERGECLRLIRRGRTGENRIPSAGWGRDKLAYPGGIVKGIEVNVADEEGGNRRIDYAVARRGADDVFLRRRRCHLRNSRASQSGEGKQQRA
jgi:hypothetical protein